MQFRFRTASSNGDVVASHICIQRLEDFSLTLNLSTELNRRIELAFIDYHIRTCVNKLLLLLLLLLLHLSIESVGLNSS